MSELSPPIGVLSDRLQLTDVPEIIDLLLASKKVQFVIKGRSMYPTLRTGDLVDVDPTEKETLETGDIVVFQKERELICHRLVEIHEKVSPHPLLTQGDATTHPDPPLSQQEILGKVISIERKGKKWIPPREIPKPSLGDTLIFSLKPNITRLRYLLLYLQSFHTFRLLYRLVFKPNVSYLIGLPTTSRPHPKFWRYLSYSSEVQKEGMKDPVRGMRYRFLAKVGEGIVGSLEIKASQDEDLSHWSISHLFVRTRYRGCGIATTLLRLGFQMLRRQEASLLEVEVASQNRPGHSLFRRLGFSVGDDSRETSRLHSRTRFALAQLPWA